ncbi:hypothetical protein L2K70_19725 [Nocardioides KLBMP 9356]|uniref:Uncharacterized protein n=1 Tax=Nocardioides potassii TaxID=2911371 RepID=A0ABS9HIB6_9ACTN|nr:hypothetical protein [Nocardioides potassii]MCF6379848.1 hypothetical protein [Nocardioides potassii]
MTLTTRIAGAAASAAITLACFSMPATADDTTTDPATEPCATQQAQVDKATTALERVTAVFARQQERVEAKAEAVEKAAPGREKAAAKKALAAARKATAETKVTKRAQQMRLAKATERLTACEAAQPPATETPAPM